MTDHQGKIRAIGRQVLQAVMDEMKTPAAMGHAAELRNDRIGREVVDIVDTVRGEIQERKSMIFTIESTARRQEETEPNRLSVDNDINDIEGFMFHMNLGRHGHLCSAFSREDLLKLATAIYREFGWS